jgi:diguanylate cyclase (GGDEF)-like protein
LRAADVLARYGGEEFVILLPDSNAQQAYIVAERIRQDIATSDLASDVGPVRVTISAGIAEILSHDDTLDKLIHRADQALYIAKQTGRNRTHIFSLSVPPFPTKA